MRVRTYCFPGCFTRPPGTSTRNHPCETTTSKPVVPRGSLFRRPILPAADGPHAARGALTKTTRPRATWGALRHVVSVRILRGFRAAGLATPGPRSLRLGSASRGNLGGRPTAVKTARSERSRILRRFRVGCRPGPPSLRADADHRAPACCAPGARPTARPSRGSTPIPRSCASSATARPFTRAESDALLDAIEAHWQRARLRPVVRRRARGPRRLPGLRRPGRAVVPARGAAGRRGRLAAGAPGVGARARDRGRARVAAPRLRGARPRGGDLDHRPGQRALDPRRAEARHAPRRRSPAPPNGPPTAAPTRFFRTMRPFHPSPLDRPRRRSHTFGPDAEPSRRERGPGVARPAALRPRRSFGS